MFSFMKTTACLLLAAIFLAAFGSGAQSVSSTVSNAPEVLPAGSPYGEAVLTRDIPYASRPTTNQNFNLYLPREKGAQPFPLVVWIHGGAWSSGSKEWDNVKYLVRDGYAIASIDYRYTPEAPFPAQIQDCNAALNFILAHAANHEPFGIHSVIGGVRTSRVDAGPRTRAKGFCRQSRCETAGDTGFFWACGFEQDEERSGGNPFPEGA